MWFHFCCHKTWHGELSDPALCCVSEFHHVVIGDRVLCLHLRMLICLFYLKQIYSGSL